MSTLSELSDAMVSAVETMSASVVCVEGRRRIPASGIAWSADGVIVTAHHVVEQDDNIGIGLPDGSSATAALVGRDPSTDLAVLRLQNAQASSLQPAAWLGADQIKVGALALALGRPGHSIMATMGIVGALRADWRAPTGAQFDHYLQTDAVMYPGFSGGPLVDASGKVVGLNSSILTRGIATAIPTETLKRVAQALLTSGHVRRGYLGVSTQPVALPRALVDQLHLGQETGLLVVGVESGSPADQGGLMLGDVIVSLGGQPVRDADDLQGALGPERVGQATPIRVVRAGASAELTITVGERK